MPVYPTGTLQQTCVGLYRIQGYRGSLFASDIKMFVGICLGDISFTRKQYITNTSLVMNNSDLNYEHVVQLTQVLAYKSASTYS